MRVKWNDNKKSLRIAYTKDVKTTRRDRKINNYDKNFKTMGLLILLLIVAGVFYIRHFWMVSGFWKRQGVVGPTPWPVVGNYGQVLLRLKKEKEFIQEIFNKYPNEKCVGLFIGTTPTLLIRNPEMVKEVLFTESEKFPDRFISSAASDYRKGLFTSFGGEYWRVLRRLTSPLLNKTALATSIYDIEVVSEKYFNSMREVVEKNSEQNINALKEKYVIKLISKIMLGTDLSEFKEDALSEMANNLVFLETSEILRIVEYIFPSIYFIFKPITSIIVAKLTSWTADLIMTKSIQEETENELNDDNKTTYMKYLFKLKKTCMKLLVDDDVVVQNMITFVVSTLHSVGVTLAYMAYELAKNPTIQGKCYEEIVTITNKYEGKYNLESLSEMKYLAMVVEEALRIQIQSYIIDRICRTQHRFSGTNITVNEGSFLYIPVECFHMNTEYFPNPENFIPERFSSENKAKIPKYTNLSFGLGPRNCIGSNLVKTIMMVAMVSCLKKFRLEPSLRTAEKLQYNYNLRIKKVNKDIWLNIIPRN